MILAAGLGTRMRPLSELRPKPVLPVRGVPLLGYGLALLAHHGTREVVVNVHHLSAGLETRARACCPAGVSLHFSREPELLGTGGGIRAAADFLRESDPCVILGGDMLLDVDLGGLIRGHRERGAAVTLLLRDDPRGATFGTIGVDGEARVRRIGGRFDLGGEARSGLYAHATVVSAAALDTLPPARAFGHLDDWIAPRLSAGATDIYGEIVESSRSVWEPVGTPAEYLAANLDPPKLSYLDADEWGRREGTLFAPGLVIGAGAQIGEGAKLERAVVWDGECVPPGLRASHGVFAGGAFHPCTPADSGTSEGRARG